MLFLLYFASVFLERATEAACRLWHQSSGTFLERGIYVIFVFKRGMLLN